jgi:transposase
MGTGLMNAIMYVGLDVHKATVSVAVAEGRRGGEVRHVGVFSNRPDHIAKLVKRLGRGGWRLSFCYEAGPCGYGLHRQLTELGHDCIVVAPSLIPVKAGERVKTDRRDAVMLAKLHGAGNHGHAASNPRMRACSSVVFAPASCCRHHVLDAGHAAGASTHV